MKTSVTSLIPSLDDKFYNSGLLDAIKKATKSTSTRKVSYAISCSSAFRDALLNLADAKKVNVGDIARSIMLTFGENKIMAFPDPGEPGINDREIVILKSGPSEGKPWRRKPRLQVRMPAGYEGLIIRKALGLALKLEYGDINILLEHKGEPSYAEIIASKNEENAKLKSIISTLTFDYLPNGVRNRNDALFILGFPPESKHGFDILKSRFRMLATIHHPDSGFGDHQRMSQLNEAIAFLRNR